MDAIAGAIIVVAFFWVLFHEKPEEISCRCGATLKTSKPYRIRDFERIHKACLRSR